ncbi:MAG: branched-chain amino acid ABC transporter permease [Actinobacteria bacterium]|jgi:branched-chain amino acid transport system permease protein|nr:branched-chain amino acid ABC transporter permease [Actinomycetota bacterium]
MKTNSLISSKNAGLVLLGVIFIVLALLPQFTHAYVIVLFSDIMKFVVLTVAWVLFAGPTRYISLASAAFYGVGLYTSAILNASLPFPLVVILAGVFCFIVALGVGALTLRLKGVYFTIFTFGLVQLLFYAVAEIERIATGKRGRFVATEGTETVYYAMFILVVVTLLVAVLIRRSRHGLALSSIGQYEEAASHSGVNVVRTKVLIFAVSSIFMGMAGAIVATRRAYIDPGIAFDLNVSFMPVLMAILGGTRHLVGPVIGAIIFAYLGEFLLTRLPDLYMLVFGAVMVIAILFLPRGLVGLAQQLWRKYRGGARAPAGG